MNTDPNTKFEKTAIIMLLAVIALLLAGGLYYTVEIFEASYQAQPGLMHK